MNLRSTLNRFSPMLMFLVAAMWLLPLLPDLDGFPIWREAEYSDLLISHWPNAYFFKQSLREWGQIPLWNPMILGGAPFAADPLAGLWYIPNWLVLVMPISLAFNVLFWLHLAWAGWGMWRFTGKLGFTDVGRWIAAIAFSGTPKFIAHIGAGHLGFVFAVSWTPWVLVETSNLAQAVLKPNKRWLHHALRTGATLGIVALADPRWTLPCGMLALSYGLYRVFQSHQTRNSQSRWDLTSRLLIILLIVSITGAAFAACLLIPLFEFAQNSTRMGMSLSDRSALSMPAVGLLGVLLPQANQPEWLAYFGIVTFCLALMSIMARIPGAKFWLAVILLAWILALGENTPFYPVFSSVIPGAGLLRIPPRMLFVVSFASAVLAGGGVDGFLLKKDPAFSGKGVMLAVFGTMIAVLLLVLGMWLVTGLIPDLGLIACVFTILTTLWIYLTRHLNLPIWLLATGWVVLVVADLGLVNSALLESRSREEALTERVILASSLAKDTGVGRILSPSYSLPYQTLAQARFETVDGINPLQLRDYRDYMSKAIGFSTMEYSVTLPPFPSGDPIEPWPMKLDTEMLAKLSVTHVISAYPLQQEHLTFAGVVDGAYIYRMNSARPRAWIQSGGTGQTAWAPVDSIERTPNWITVNVSGPGELVLSELAYPGWQVSMNGVEIETKVVDGIFRGADLPSGNHVVKFRFFPWSVLIGIGITFLSILSLIVVQVKR